MVKKLEDLRVYVIAGDIADRIWLICDKWPIFAKRTVGEQFVKAADSIGANIAEGYGRYHYKENITFLYYARGSLEETKFWLCQASKRDLITNEEFTKLNKKLEELAPQLNAYIRSIGKTPSNK